MEAQGNASERFVLHEILKRHLGRDVPMAEFRDLEQSTAELPSPQQVRQDRRISDGTQLAEVPVELPSLEETRHWQVQHQQAPSSPLAELRADRDPVELPATERPTTSQRYSPFPPPNRSLPPLPLPPPLQRPRPLQPEQLPHEPPPTYIDSVSR